MNTLTPAMAVNKVDNSSGYPANVIMLQIKDAAGAVVASQSTPSAPTAAIPAFQVALVPGAYTAEAQCLNTKGNRIGELVTAAFTVEAPVAFVPVSLSISVA